MAEAHSADPIVVMGIAGSGKSTIGSAIAQRLGRPFVDADDLHPEANIARMRAGTPLTDKDRMPWLSLVGTRLAAGDRPIVACSALRRAYRDVLRSLAPTTAFIHLDPPADVVGVRLDGRGGHFAGRVLLPSQLAALEPLDADESGCRLATSGGIDATVISVLDYLRGAALDSSA